MNALNFKSEIRKINFAMMERSNLQQAGKEHIKRTTLTTWCEKVKENGENRRFSLPSETLAIFPSKTSRTSVLDKKFSDIVLQKTDRKCKSKK